MLDLGALAAWLGEHRAVLWCASSIILSVSGALHAYRQPSVEPIVTRHVTRYAARAATITALPAPEDPVALDPRAA